MGYSRCICNYNNLEFLEVYWNYSRLLTLFYNRTDNTTGININLMCYFLLVNLKFPCRERRIPRRSGDQIILLQATDTGIWGQQVFHGKLNSVARNVLKFRQLVGPCWGGAVGFIWEIIFDTMLLYPSCQIYFKALRVSLYEAWTCMWLYTLIPCKING